MRDFTPALPADLTGNIDEKLLMKAEDLCLKSAGLAGDYPKAVTNAIKELLRTVNSYYSNLIESEGTHPIDIERAARKEFDTDDRRRYLQQLSLAYIKTQRWIEEECRKGKCDPYSPAFILAIHRHIYSHPGVKDHLAVKKPGGGTVTITPGTFREVDVEVGNHIAPPANHLSSLMQLFEMSYMPTEFQTRARRTVAAFAAHHRLAWIHPFIDGNGRVSRLLLDAAFASMDLPGYGLWNISRGLARKKEGYREMLALADIVRQGEHDGRGSLSMRSLKSFVEWMTVTACDQIDFMSSMLQLDKLSDRINLYVRHSRDGLIEGIRLPKHSDRLLSTLLMRGEIRRGEVKQIINTSDRTASSLVKSLLETGHIESVSEKGPISIRFGIRFSEFLFPNLFPPKSR